MNRFLLLLIYFISISICQAQEAKRYPVTVEDVLVKAGKNRLELEKALEYFRKSKDPLKYQAIIFLIANMDIHYSRSYQLVDSLRRQVMGKDTAYASRIVVRKPITYRDIDSIKGDFLINNVERAFSSWKLSKHKSISFNDFCEYILPYRITSEPLQDWRIRYSEKFAWISDSLKKGDFKTVISYAAEDYKRWFKNIWGIQNAGTSLPNLGPNHLLDQKKGYCQDVAALEVFTLRSQGIPCSFNIVPFWATSSYNHFLNTVYDFKMLPHQLDVDRSPALDNPLKREPSKVFRVTYSKQVNTLAQLIPSNDIPPGFLKMSNYVDVTNEYWAVSDLTCTLTEKRDSPIVYACVFNAGEWKPTWWGRQTGNKVQFSNMTKGVAYLPCYYINKKLVPAGPVHLSGKQDDQNLAIDTASKFRLCIKEEDNYIVFRPEKKYRLFYWNQVWKLAGEQTVKEGQHEIYFNDVPTNTLYRLVPEYSQRLERPFTIENGERKWW